MQQKVYDFWLHAYAMFSAAATLLLICVGGLVTSHGAGLAVPDWPTTFGYNMFFFPFDKWVGGIFYEHTHRLVASGVGMLTVILAVWLWFRESRRWVRWLGVAALIAVIAQGVLGGLRVTALKDELGIFHGALAQLFFILICSIALFTSRWWLTTSSDHNRSNRREEDADPFNVVTGIKDQQPPHVGCYEKGHGFARICLVVTAAMFLQLVLGATMRHQHAGLAISDFPLAHGAIWPDTSPEAVQRYNQLRGEVAGLKEITSAQIYLQMAHRIMAALLLAAVGAVAWISRRQSGFAPRISFSWFGLILIQAGLGAATIWTNKSADIATAHVAVGAISLATGALLTLMSHRASGESVRASAPAGVNLPSSAIATA